MAVGVGYGGLGECCVRAVLESAWFVVRDDIEKTYALRMHLDLGLLGCWLLRFARCWTVDRGRDRHRTPFRNGGSEVAVWVD